MSSQIAPRVGFVLSCGTHHPEAAGAGFRLCSVPRPRSPADEEARNFGQYLLRLTGEFVMGRAGQRVRNERKGVARGAVRLCDGLAVRDETIGAGSRDRNAASLQEGPVEHAAR